MDSINERETRTSVQRMMIAAGCFVICIGSFTFLVMNNHDVAAGVVMGTTVMGVVVQMLKS